MLGSLVVTSTLMRAERLFISNSKALIGTCSLIYICVGCLVGLFSFAWFIVGAIILFNSNTDCIDIGSTHVVFALVVENRRILSMDELAENGRISRPLPKYIFDRN